jgi:hypothetical protein
MGASLPGRRFLVISTFLVPLFELVLASALLVLLFLMVLEFILLVLLFNIMLSFFLFSFGCASQGAAPPRSSTFGTFGQVAVG